MPVVVGWWWLAAIVGTAWLACGVGVAVAVQTVRGMRRRGEVTTDGEETHVGVMAWVLSMTAVWVGLLVLLGVWHGVAWLVNGA